MINNKKYNNAEDWFNSSTNKNGSWWNEWYEWKKLYLGEMELDKKIKIDLTDLIELAPGSYVKKKINNLQLQHFFIDISALQHIYILCNTNIGDFYVYI